MLIGAIRFSRSIKNSPKYIRKRSYKNFNSHLFIQEVRKISWLDVYLCSDVDEAVRILSSKITNVLDRIAPMKTVQIRANYSPWLSQETKNLMSRRDNLHREASENKNSEKWKEYKKLRNTINNKLKS